MLDTGGKGDGYNTDCSREGEVLITKLLSFNQVMMFHIFLTQLKVTVETMKDGVLLPNMIPFHNFSYEHFTFLIYSQCP